jgi:hypothetical protein
VRARNIKPGFFDNEDLAEGGPCAQVLFEGLWCLADREGRLENRPMRIKAKVFPYYDPKEYGGKDVNDLLIFLAEKRFIRFYAVDGLNLISILNFTKHQSPHSTERQSNLPPAAEPPTSHIEPTVNYEEPTGVHSELTVNPPLDNGEQKHGLHADANEAQKSKNGLPPGQQAQGKLISDDGKKSIVNHPLTILTVNPPLDNGGNPPDSLIHGFTDSLIPDSLEKDLSTAEPPTPSFSVQDLAILWNENAPPELPKVHMPFKRPPKAMAKLRDAVNRNPDRDWWLRVVAKTRDSPFLLGVNDRGWKASIDFVVENSEVILDGKYDGGKKVQPKGWEALKESMQRRKSGAQ